MGRGMRKVKPGQKLSGNLSASTINTLIDDHGRIAAIERQLQRFADRSTPRAGIVLVKNSEAFAFSRFDVVGLDDILYGPSDNLSEFRNNFAFKAKQPSDAHSNKFAVLLEPIDTGGSRVVSAVADGITVARVNVLATDHKYARVRPGEWTQFDSADAGPVDILWKEAGTGTSKYAVVRLCGSGTSELVKAKCEQANGIPRDGSGTVRIYRNNMATNQTVTAHLNWLARSKVSNGKEIVIKWFQDEANGQGQWVILLAECE